MQQISEILQKKKLVINENQPKKPGKPNPIFGEAIATSKYLWGDEKQAKLLLSLMYRHKLFNLSPLRSFLGDYSRWDKSAGLVVWWFKKNSKK